jgi:hypothetical protein
VLGLKVGSIDPVLPVTAGSEEATFAETVQINGYGDPSWQQATDEVGWTPYAVGYYRSTRASRGLPMPCNFNKYQIMTMKCSNGVASIQYQTNQLSGVIDVTTVSSWRGGQGQTEPF